jgi:hypothetical protein
MRQPVTDFQVCEVTITATFSTQGKLRAYLEQLTQGRLKPHSDLLQLVSYMQPIVTKGAPALPCSQFFSKLAQSEQDELRKRYDSLLENSRKKFPQLWKQ